MVISVCQFCQKNIKYKSIRKYCSRDCFKKHGEQKRTCKCLMCAKIYIIKKGETVKRERTFCSQICFKKYYCGPNNHAYKGIKGTKLCQLCNKEFEITSTNQKNEKKYCSHQCYFEYSRVYGHPLKHNLFDNCHYCQVQIKITKRQIGGRNFCSRRCADLGHSLKMKGNNNSNYLHGESEFPYKGTWTLSDKERIRERDNRECKLCFLKEKDHHEKLHVHHIDFNKSNHSNQNLITLCRACHMQLHAKLTRNIWKEKLLKRLEEKK